MATEPQPRLSQRLLQSRAAASAGARRRRHRGHLRTCRRAAPLHPVSGQPADRRPRAGDRRNRVRSSRWAQSPCASPRSASSCSLTLGICSTGRRPPPRRSSGSRPARGASTSGRSKACPTCCCRRSSSSCAIEHPAVDIRVFEEDTAVERLLAGELDLTFWVGPLDGPIESVKLLDDPYVVSSPAAATFPTGQCGANSSMGCRWCRSRGCCATWAGSRTASPQRASSR